MLGRRWWGFGRRNVGGNGLQERRDIVSLRQLNSDVEGDPCALVLSITALHLFVYTLLDLALEDTGALRFVQADDLEDLSCIEPAIGPSAHHGDRIDDAFVHGHARIRCL